MAITCVLNESIYYMKIQLSMEYIQEMDNDCLKEIVRAWINETLSMNLDIGWEVNPDDESKELLCSLKESTDLDKINRVIQNTVVFQPIQISGKRSDGKHIVRHYNVNSIELINRGK